MHLITCLNFYADCFFASRLLNLQNVSAQGFRRCGGEFLSHRWERNQRIAGDAANGPAFPGPRLQGLSPDRCCNISGAQNLSDLPQFNPGPLGPCVCKNFRFCHSTTAPEFAEPTITVRRRPLPGPLAGIPRRRSGTASLKFSSHQGPVARVEPHPSTPFLRADHKRPRKGEFPRKQGSGERRIWTRSVHPEPSPAAFW